MRRSYYEQRKHSLSEVDEGFGEANLSQHAISGYCSLLGRVEDDMSLFLCIFVVIVYGAAGSEGWIIDCEI